MQKRYFVLLLINIILFSNPAQSRRYVNIGAGWYNYAWKKLNNPNNSKYKSGQVIFAGFDTKIKPKLYWPNSFLAGRILDLTINAGPFANAAFVEYQTGLKYQFLGNKPSSPIQISLYGVYSFQYFGKTGEQYFSGLQTAVSGGINTDILCKNKLHIFLSIGSLQKLNQDFRTCLLFRVGFSGWK